MQDLFADLLFDCSKKAVVQIIPGRYRKNYLEDFPCSVRKVNTLKRVKAQVKEEVEEEEPPKKRAEVQCPYGGCAVMIGIDEFMSHAADTHMKDGQMTTCPICPFFNDGENGVEENLMLHLHDVHSKYIPESIENELDAYYESCLEDMLNATLTNQEAALRTIEEQTPKKPVESPAVRPSPEPPSDIPPPLCVEGGIVYENYKIREGDKITECVICCEDIAPGQIASRLACFCVFHRPCFEEWYVKNPSCPLHPPMSKE